VASGVLIGRLGVWKCGFAGWFRVAILRSGCDASQLQRPTEDQWKPVSGLGQIQGLELVPIYNETKNRKTLSQRGPQVGIVRGMVRERDRRIKLRDPAFQKR